jgi:hypothetical protein
MKKENVREKKGNLIVLTLHPSRFLFLLQNERKTTPLNLFSCPFWPISRHLPNKGEKTRKIS